ncbi:UDP-N-acetylglucosamine-N-acetylmuramylpentapeptide N-acetylglucosamine transferase [Tangfeifania diversioriginum]|uniref:UDP-N-acetylglucosamine--N-acetylmuramyl-(pentapeptide) pyrophosphoryl-undecaprenol N-acetylglucosamine transferase n=1 Tax=Tangfeifania diversioriginum TaxID=1168035 RepID=A0A1M6A1K4_9BACT|nr:undecaprenyldiphospho-muramoylpentapeptide beta-N-acetylglucosaminyltransferase [Tangfeifania diversioriginum]SHI30394.1 UDP-N-acetylglucosamine-N-acetylmuramylpentapeptide N-acetylglucosamine transferase [Tangfeifania diversioriginum]
MKIERVIISGGGTGGHIFPALAIAGEIGNRFPDAEILFVGALGRMEMERVPAAGYKIIGLPVMGFPRKPGLKMLKFVTSLLKSNRLAKKIINEFNPQIAIGVGGFASGPLLRAAAKKQILTLIQEQNSYAGITNRLLGKKAGAICVAYDKMERYFPAEQIVFTGNPVRENLLKKIDDRKEALSFFGLKEEDKVVLVIGGSLGARSINNAMLKNVEVMAKSGVQFIWQTGSIYYCEITEKMKDATPDNLHIHEFLSRMDLAYAASGVVISRAGAGTISELCLVGKPSILVPSPNVAEDHQTKNAMALAEKNAAIMIPDHKIDEQLLPEAIRLINNPEECSRLSLEIKKLAKPDATRHIVDEAEKLLKR